MKKEEQRDSISGLLSETREGRDEKERQAEELRISDGGEIRKSKKRIKRMMKGVTYKRRRRNGRKEEEFGDEH